LLRSSNIDAAKHSRAVTKLLVERIRKQWPDVKIIIRGDSGFCRWKLMRWCDIRLSCSNRRSNLLTQRIASMADWA
jgi:hypothetical protein